jgi:glutamate formiminotransferase / 5-formyltetrahydrofolate cyclo-ligase
VSLVECVPNFSEGRRTEVVDEIVAAIEAIRGAKVLDRESDADHNRSVVTFAGKPSAVIAAAYAGAEKAAELIDLRKHKGAHPRMGATDVIPLIPLAGSTTEECCSIARELARRIGEFLQIPCFLYGDAASRPERRSLSELRKGEFEGLREVVGKDPTRVPDEGPHFLHPSAGITAVGVRFFLIAFNVNLQAPDPALAKRIAKEIRASSGGMPNLQALGFALPERGLSQVSMNLTDFRVTSIRAAFDAVRTRAEAAGVEIVESEIVGLVPEDAVRDVDAKDLKLAHFTDGQILENRIRALGLAP